MRPPSSRNGVARNTASAEGRDEAEWVWGFFLMVFGYFFITFINVLFFGIVILFCLLSLHPLSLRA